MINETLERVLSAEPIVKKRIVYSSGVMSHRPVFIGYDAGFGVDTGQSNVCIGAKSLKGLK